MLQSGIAIWGTLAGFGPFVRSTANESLLLLQAFMGVTAVVTLVLAAVVRERRGGGGGGRAPAGGGPPAGAPQKPPTTPSPLGRGPGGGRAPPAAARVGLVPGRGMAE